ncbi:sensor histidine kinase [Ferruginibacter sp.]
MHKSDELSEVVVQVQRKFQELDISMEARVAVVVVFDKDSRNFNQWVASPDFSNIYISTPYFQNPILDDFWTAKESGVNFYSKAYSTEVKNSYFQFFFENSSYENFEGLEEQKKWLFEQEFYSYSPAFEKNSSIGIADFSGNLLNESDKEIIKRFAKIFEQAYVRFLDLQKAEAQAREAQIEAALERVRSRSMGMQKSEELKEVIKIVYQQMRLLNIHLDHAGFVVDYKPKADWHFWIADEQDIPSKISHPYFESVWANQFNEAKEKWTDFFATNLNFEEKNKFYNQLLSYVPGLTEASKKFYLSCPGLAASTVLLDNVGLYIENFSGIPYSNEENTTLMRFGKVFQQTYTRFLDLQKAEAHAIQAEEDLIKLQTEKKKAEDALTQLQVTQKQLIQSEKMASLGELTAGIAHEIQNPLNFVNNFSEVSNELIDEMKDEFKKGDTEEGFAIADDIKQNLEKILHHGKRADAIVKGMLQHSSSGSGKKEATDINKLADEYLRLAYHGLRAKDKSFNATMKTDYDETIGNINIIPQDIGRVILNLITNAFYATNEKAKLDFDIYEPIVTVTTKSLGTPSGDGGSIEIRVADNGNGIPQKVLDKIFQPFFTTKPTGQGTGLGLSLSYDFVKAHGGELKVETREGEGAEFIILLSV